MKSQKDCRKCSRIIFIVVETQIRIGMQKNEKNIAQRYGEKNAARVLRSQFCSVKAAVKDIKNKK
jgi:hypothetical protein